MTMLTNWHEARFFDFDFAAAVVRGDKPLHERVNGLEQPSLVLNVSHYQGINLRNVGTLMGKDAAGNWWLKWTMRAGAWTRFEELLQQGADLGKPVSTLV